MIFWDNNLLIRKIFIGGFIIIDFDVLIFGVCLELGYIWVYIFIIVLILRYVSYFVCWCKGDREVNKLKF